jgi:hypothetical protein
MELTKTERERVLAKVHVLDNGCHLFGKQKVGVVPSVKLRSKTYYVRHLLLNLAGRTIPRGMQALARPECVPHCVNPDHITIMKRKGLPRPTGGRPVGVVELKPRRPYVRNGVMVFPKRDRGRVEA